MTVSSQANRAGPYLGNGTTTTFPFSMKSFAPSDIQAVVTDLNGNDTFLSYGSDYTVAINSDQTASPGGSVTLTVAPAAGYSLTLLRNLGFTQGASLPDQGGFYPEVIEAALDRLTMLAQQLKEKIDRAYVAGVASPVVSSLQNYQTAAQTAATNAGTSATSAAISAALAQTASQFANSLVITQGSVKLWLTMMDNTNNPHAVGGLENIYSTSAVDFGSIVGATFPNETLPIRSCLSVGTQSYNLGTVP
jgi:hypothetical protein